jgi:hypothetical protein
MNKKLSGQGNQSSGHLFTNRISEIMMTCKLNSEQKVLGCCVRSDIAPADGEKREIKHLAMSQLSLRGRQRNANYELATFSALQKYLMGRN